MRRIRHCLRRSACLLLLLPFGLSITCVRPARANDPAGAAVITPRQGVGPASPAFGAAKAARTAGPTATVDGLLSGKDTQVSVVRRSRGRVVKNSGAG